jgi:hypothetical protein
VEKYASIRKENKELKDYAIFIGKEFSGLVSLSLSDRKYLYELFEKREEERQELKDKESAYGLKKEAQQTVQSEETPKQTIISQEPHSRPLRSSIIRNLGALLIQNIQVLIGAFSLGFLIGVVIPGIMFAMEMTPPEGGVGLEGVIGIFLGGLVGGVILTIIVLVILLGERHS